MLGLDEDRAGDKEVRRRFRHLLREAHPDHGAESADAAERIADLTEARKILLGVRGESEHGSRPRTPARRAATGAQPHEMSCSMATRPGALLLAPGAGSSSTHPTSVAIEALVSPLPVVRMDFPYRKAGRRAPDRAPVLVAAVRDEAAALVAAARPADRLVLGGRSMGGRMCSMAVAEGSRPAGLVLLSYPLHPRASPTSSRRPPAGDHGPHPRGVGHQRPVRPPRRAAAPPGHDRAPVTYVWVEGAGHEWKGPDRQGGRGRRRLAQGPPAAGAAGAGGSAIWSSGLSSRADMWAVSGKAVSISTATTSGPTARRKAGP